MPNHTFHVTLTQVREYNEFLDHSSSNILQIKTEENVGMTINQQIQDYSEKEAFDNMIKYAKKGDRVEFIRSIEQ